MLNASLHCLHSPLIIIEGFNLGVLIGFEFLLPCVTSRIKRIQIWLYWCRRRCSYLNLQSCGSRSIKWLFDEQRTTAVIRCGHLPVVFVEHLGKLEKGAAPKMCILSPCPFSDPSCLHVKQRKLGRLLWLFFKGGYPAARTHCAYSKHGALKVSLRLNSRNQAP